MEQIREVVLDVRDGLAPHRDREGGPGAAVVSPVDTAGHPHRGAGGPGGSGVGDVGDGAATLHGLCRPDRETRNGRLDGGARLKEGFDPADTLADVDVGRREAVPERGIDRLLDLPEAGQEEPVEDVGVAPVVDDDPVLIG